MLGIPYQAIVSQREGEGYFVMGLIKGADTDAVRRGGDVRRVRNKIGPGAVDELAAAFEVSLELGAFEVVGLGDTYDLCGRVCVDRTRVGVATSASSNDNDADGGHGGGGLSDRLWVGTAAGFRNDVDQTAEHGGDGC